MCAMSLRGNCVHVGRPFSSAVVVKVVHAFVFTSLVCLRADALKRYASFFWKSARTQLQLVDEKQRMGYPRTCENKSYTILARSLGCRSLIHLLIRPQLRRLQDITTSALSVCLTGRWLLGLPSGPF